MPLLCLSFVPLTDFIYTVDLVSLTLVRRYQDQQIYAISCMVENVPGDHINDLHTNSDHINLNENI